ncbi:hypothetical protein DFQ29_005121 [Apophysomyces sp. BC1021]|nr:hypothetical protein DFQ29_005121 [Apophysomyces sp. BC1021]
MTITPNYKDLADYGLLYGNVLYSFLSVFACMAGGVGVFKNDVKKLQLFSFFYWVDLVFHVFLSVSTVFTLAHGRREMCQEILMNNPNTNLDMETCEIVLTNSLWVTTFVLMLALLLKLHFAFAIRAYAVSVKEQQDTENNGLKQIYAVPYPPSYASTLNPDSEDQVLYVAGQEFIPDNKKPTN